MIEELKRQTAEMALALGVVGLMNVQFAIKGDDIYVLEVNPRASRTVPFVAKAIGAPIAAIAARLMAGEQLTGFDLPSATPNHVAVKEAVLPFARFPGVDTLLGPEMRSTGEVMGIDEGFARAFLKAQLAAGVVLPTEGAVFISVKDADKPVIVDAAQRLDAMGFRIIATKGTAAHLAEHGIKSTVVSKVYQGRPNIVDTMKDGGVALVFNTTDLPQSIADSASIRATALTMRTPYYTTGAGALAAARAIENKLEGVMEVATLQAYAAE
jgi:carbamoyl-phosphate synthase large subunit